jgi:hypothetical protein
MEEKDAQREEPQEERPVSWKERLSRVAALFRKMEGRNWGRKELVLLFVLGALVGFMFKTVAYASVTMGFQDYTVAQKGASAYDLNALQKELVAKGESSVAAPRALGGGGVCGQ